MLSFPRRDRVHSSATHRPIRAPQSLGLESLEGRAVLAAAAVAGVPDLVAASDSAWAGDVRATADNLTTVTTPTFTGVAKNAVSVTLFNGATPLGTVPVVNNVWAFSIDPAAALAAGRYAIVAQATNAAGAAGARSRPLVMEVVTAAPAPATVGVAPASDSGAIGDGITNVRNPVVGGIAPRGSRVVLQVDGGAEIRVATNPRTGAWAFKTPALADGAHAITVRSESVVGLQSAPSTLALTIDTVQPMAKLAFVPEDGQVEVTFSRPVAGLTLGHFTVSGDLGGRLMTLALTNPSVIAETGGFVLEQKAGTPPGTVYRIRSNLGDVFGGSYRITLDLSRAAPRPRGVGVIVETQSGAANGLAPTTSDFGVNLRGSPYCIA